MMHRTNSEGGASSTASSQRWRIPSALRKFGSISGSSKDDKNATNKHGSSSVDNDSHEPSIHEISSIHETSKSNYHQLQALVVRMRGAPSGPNHVDGAYKEFDKISKRCAALCDAILREEIKLPRKLSDTNDTLPLIRHDSLADTPRSPSALFDHRSSFSGRSLAEVVTNGGSRSHHGGDLWLTPIRDWKACLEVLTEHFKTSLAETYKSYERDATPEMLEALFSSKKFRREAVHRMRNASVTKILSADPQFFPRYEIRFRNYEKVKQELNDIRKLLQAGESGISPARVVEEFAIAPRGDVVLEFANLGPDATGNEPVLRFRASSALLSETSPIFARLFSGHPNSLYLHETDDITDLLPPPPVPYFCDDGSEVKLYRMPQQEFNRFGSLEILLHAAHMHNDKVPRDVTFEQFVAIAECSLRYKSTSPLELVVEHRWLPQWMHKGADDMPDGLLIISYAFGLRQLFTRMSKSAILNLADEKDLHGKPWPKKIKDKVWAVRCAKVDQLYASCRSTIQEYIRPPAQDESSETNQHISLSELDSHLASPIQPAMALTSTPRCPKGNHWCDASNLGWMMLVYNELGLLPTIVQPSLMSHLPNVPPPSKSLAQMMETLRSTPSPPAPLHPGGVCDPVPAFRASIADIYNSVTGLTLFDISGKSHGWALSKHKVSEPQLLLTAGLNRMAAAHENIHSVVSEFPEEIRLKILGEMEGLEDLQAAARINRGFYETYKRNELQLMRNILRADRIRWGSIGRYSLEEDKAESKILKAEADMLKERGFGDGADAITLRSEDDEGLYDSDDSDEDDDSVDPLTRNGSISSQGGRLHAGHDDDDVDILARDPPPPFQSREANPPPPLLPVVNVDESHDGSEDDDTATPTTPRQRSFELSDESTTPSDRTSVVSAEDIYDPPMTEEEARRILWPDHLVVTPPPERGAVSPGVEGLREKFRVGDISFIEGLEDKTLIKTETKQLQSDHDTRMGLLKDDARPSSSSSTRKASNGVEHIEKINGRNRGEDEVKVVLS
ncbi:uncharacterized protein TrAFT101_010563 [Trichoderma asperellum]|uniref:Uncharacterized protein n=1 Tax=Trichoderma asperellum (strain ATCC 204424 / CBS 433.97 / NBRC 101777) TaxID=1042311 RepID=A0A2T3YT83_TRIA4|nr:hypothetical protein M441DRAFT_152327 [Trichoderma asperellum CBS 433.97]PTB35714.1 hypothetical protein M441DRAFT_152327 [Trichoderma asperellum CBS 433.97]UKZ95747.1 hypothetical protein TrAFT101_010563 [Trichoderma asperellum]